MTNLSLQNIDNYKPDYTHSTAEIFTKYVGIINEYFLQCLDTLQMKDIKYYKYIIYKGLETITHVFKIILLYTKNLNITYTHCQKSLYYYVEFICQIDNESHSFLQLNTKDAALFVYKKTIFDINNEYRKEFVSLNDSCDITTNIELYVQLYFTIVTSLLYEYNFTHSNKNGFLKYINTYNNNFIKNLLNITLNKSEQDITSKLKTITFLCQDLNMNIITKLEYINCYAKCLKKKNISLQDMKNKLSHKEKNKYINKSFVKFTNWLFTPLP